MIKLLPLPLIRDDNGEEYGGGENNIVHGIQKLGEHYGENWTFFVERPSKNYLKLD